MNLSPTGAGFIRTCATLLALTYALSGLAAAPTKFGTVCIAPVTEKIIAADSGDPRGPSPRRNFNFSVQFDKGNRLVVPREKGLLVTDLALDGKHLVRIRDEDKVIESFFFTFKARGSTHLCLSYGPWYETWDLSPPARRSWCKCQ